MILFFRMFNGITRRYKKDFPEGVETEDKVLIWIVDNRKRDIRQYLGWLC